MIKFFLTVDDRVKSPAVSQSKILRGWRRLKNLRNAEKTKCFKTSVEVPKTSVKISK